jgi:hypothetical protein
MIVTKLRINKHVSFWGTGVFCDVFPGRTLLKWPHTQWIAGPMGGDGRLNEERRNLGLPFLLLHALVPLLVWRSDCLHLHLPFLNTSFFFRRRSHNSLHKKFRTWWITSLNTSPYFVLICSWLPSRHTLILLCPKLSFAFLHPHFSKSSSTSSIQLNRDLPLFFLPLVCLSLIPLLSLHSPFLKYGQAITVYILSIQLQ